MYNIISGTLETWYQEPAWYDFDFTGIKIWFRMWILYIYGHTDYRLQLLSEIGLMSASFYGFP